MAQLSKSTDELREFRATMELVRDTYLNIIDDLRVRCGQRRTPNRVACYPQRYLVANLGPIAGRLPS